MHILKKKHNAGKKKIITKKKSNYKKRNKFSFQNCVNYIPKGNRLAHLVISLKCTRFMGHKLVEALILSEKIEEKNNS